MKFQLNDGGRIDAGFKGITGDCVCRAIAIATEQPYAWIYYSLYAASTKERRKKGKRSSPRTGVHIPTIRKFMEGLGWKWNPTMGIGTGCKVHLRETELPSGRLVVSVSRHLVAVIDGVINDNHDCSRNGMRCVYGYWRKL